MRQAIDETNRRREKQVAYNTERGIDPQPLRKRIADITDLIAREDEDTEALIGGGGRQRSRGKAPVPGMRSTGEQPGRHAATSSSLPATDLADLIQQLTAADARRRRGAALRARRPAARRGLRAEEGAARHARGRRELTAPRRRNVQEGTANSWSLASGVARRPGEGEPVELSRTFEIWTLAVLTGLLLLDLALVARRPHVPSLRESGLWVAFYVAARPGVLPACC